MADEQEIPTSHGVETQERGLFYFGNKEDNEVMAASFEQNAHLQVSEEEEKKKKKKPSSISSSSSSSEEEEEVVGEDGEKIKIKKKKIKGLQEMLIEKVGNKVENTSVPEEQPPPALDAYPHVNKPEEKAAGVSVTHPPPLTVVEEKEKKGLLEKIKDTIPGFH